MTKIRNRKLMRDVIKWRSEACASIWVTITDIWTKFGTEHKCHTINTPEWLNSHNWKSNMAAADILNFRKMSITLDWIKISCIKLYAWEDASRPCGDDHVTKSRNRKLIRVTSSNQGLKHMCVDLSDYNRLFEPNLVQNTNATLSTRRNG